MVYKIEHKKLFNSKTCKCHSKMVWIDFLGNFVCIKRVNEDIKKFGYKITELKKKIKILEVKICKEKNIITNEIEYIVRRVSDNKIEFSAFKAEIRAREYIEKSWNGDPEHSSQWIYKIVKVK